MDNALTTPPRSIAECFDELAAQVEAEQRERDDSSPVMSQTEGGQLLRVGPRQSSWYLYYVNICESARTPTFEKTFRRRFRMPYSGFLAIVDMANLHEPFRRLLAQDATGRESSPIELMILGSFRYLARGWTLDELKEGTNINEETHRQFLHLFLDWGITVLFAKNVTDGAIVARKLSRQAFFAKLVKHFAVSTRNSVR